MEKTMFNNIYKQKPEVGKQVFIFDKDAKLMMIATMRKIEFMADWKPAKEEWFGSPVILLEDYFKPEWFHVNIHEYPYWMEIPDALKYMSTITINMQKQKIEKTSYPKTLDI